MAKLKIESENILPIIKRWLYSDREIFVRELVANGCDAIQKLKHLEKQGPEELRIDIRIEDKTLRFIDNGIGMSVEEVEKYIAQVAFSGAREFLERYKAKEEIIGHFGLGFYSAFMVAERVEIDTRSFSGEGAHWSCEGSAEYELVPGERQERGTEVILHIEDEEFLEESRLRNILRQHCLFLPVPIYLNGQKINEEPLWTKTGSDEEYRAFYRLLYPGEPEPLFWIDLKVDYPFELKGILYFPKMERDLPRSGLKLFCNRVFVTDSCKELLPDYLAMLRGVIDGPDIPLNVSRSSLQMDRTVRQIATHISKKVADRLASLYQSDRERYIEAWPDLEWIVKLGAMQDEKFLQRVERCLIWKNTSGHWVNLPQEGEVLYTAADGPFLELYKGKEVLYSNNLIDVHLMSFLEAKGKLTFKRVDGQVEGERTGGVLDAEGKSEGTRIEEAFRSHLDMEVEARKLEGELPALLVIDEQQRRLRDGLRQELPVKKTLVVNSNSPLVTAAMENPALARAIYDLTALGQREMDPKELDQFVVRTTSLLAQLTNNQ